MIYCFLANGFEEIEALTAVDILRRAGIDVQTVSVSGKKVKGAHNIVVIPDKLARHLRYTDDIEGIILPGGMPGASELDHSKIVKAAVQYCNSMKLPIAAICAAPMILGHLGVLRGKNATCYPTFESELTGATVQNAKVVVDDNIITGRGPGCSAEFALALVEKISGKETAEKIAESMQMYV